MERNKDEIARLWDRLEGLEAVRPEQLREYRQARVESRERIAGQGEYRMNSPQWRALAPVVAAAKQHVKDSYALWCHTGEQIDNTRAAIMILGGSLAGGAHMRAGR